MGNWQFVGKTTTRQHQHHHPHPTTLPTPTPTPSPPPLAGASIFQTKNRTGILHRTRDSVRSIASFDRPLTSYFTMTYFTITCFIIFRIVPYWIMKVITTPACEILHQTFNCLMIFTNHCTVSTFLASKITLTLSTIKMELIVASSKGRNTGTHLANPLLNIPIKIHFKKSTSINTVTWPHQSVKFSNDELPSQPIHVYFLAGLPDITASNHFSTKLLRACMFSQIIM